MYLSLLAIFDAVLAITCTAVALALPNTFIPATGETSPVAECSDTLHQTTPLLTGAISVLVVIASVALIERSIPEPKNAGAEYKTDGAWIGINPKQTPEKQAVGVMEVMKV